MFALSVIATLAGTPLRIAEAARDIGCALAEDHAEGSIEVPDGGVGDDSGVTIEADNVDPSIVLAVVADLPPFRDDPASAFHSGSQSSARFRGIPGSNKRLSKLQRFRC